MSTRAATILPYAVTSIVAEARTCETRETAYALTNAIAELATSALPGAFASVIEFARTSDTMDTDFEVVEQFARVADSLA